jgi:metal-responsive CopG/Arc/MetJ family transcriptional regulator
MAGKRIELDLPDELYSQLERVADAIGVNNRAEAALIGLAQWVTERIAELDDRDPAQRYFVNEALDELNEKKK